MDNNDDEKRAARAEPKKETMEVIQMMANQCEG